MIISRQSTFQSKRTPLAVFTDLWHNRQLIMRLSIKEIQGRYRGSFLGLFWCVVTPLLMLAVYTFVFSVIFKSRWGSSAGNQTDFALRLFLGLIVFNLFAECVNRSPGIVLENVDYVKRVVFPLEILPCILLSNALFNAAVSSVVLMLGYIVILGVPPWTVILMPLVFIPLFLFTLGVSWFLASLGVFIRDLRHATAIFSSLLMFISPVFYPVEAIPLELRSLVYFNPLTLILEQSRQVLFEGIVPDWKLWLCGLGASIFVSWAGYLWFSKTRKGFADVI